MNKLKKSHYRFVLLVGKNYTIEKELKNNNIKFLRINSNNKSYDEIFNEISNRIKSSSNLYDTLFFNNESNKSVYLALKYYNEFQELSNLYNIKIIINKPDIYNKLHNKYNLYTFCNENNILTIPTFKNNNTKEIKNLLLKNKKVIVKPLDDCGGHNNYLCYSLSDIEIYMKKHNYDILLIQPFIDGTILGFNFISDKKNIIDFRIYQTIDLFYNKQSIRHSGFLKKRLNNPYISKKLYNLCKKIIDLTEYNGIGEFEVLWCKKTNKLYLMDFNPRISGDINQLAYNKGSFLNNYINFMLGKPIKKHKHFSNNFTTIKYKAFKVLLKRVVDQDPLSLLNIFDWIYLLFIALCNLFKVIVNKI